MSEITANPRPERVRFRAIEREDLVQLRDWRNQLMDNFRQYRHLNTLNQEEWLRRITEGNEHIMMAVENYGGYLVGVVGMTYIDWVRRSAEASIYIARAYGGKGYGKAALRSLIDYGFGELGFHRIWAEIFGFNEASIRLFISVGFRKEGVFRHGHFTDGKWSDSQVFSILEDEWRLLS